MNFGEENPTDNVTYSSHYDNDTVLFSTAVRKAILPSKVKMRSIWLITRRKIPRITRRRRSLSFVSEMNLFHFSSMINIDSAF